MIDIHHHCLPGVDDGPPDLGEARELCAMARDEGIETTVATPHVLRGRWRSYSPRELTAIANELRDAIGDSPRLLLGSEYFFGHDMAEVLQSGSAVLPLAGSQYVLMELASNSVPPMLEQPLYRAQLDGWVPIIAHPERNTVFQAHPELLARLVHHGAKVQLTLTSLTGAFGSKAEAAARTFLARKMVHFVATDAHNTTKRPPRTREALQVLREVAGDEVAEALSRANPLAVIEKRGLPYDFSPVEEAAGGFLTRLRSFFGARQG